MCQVEIPMEALEAAARAVYETWCKVHGVAETSLPWEDIDDEERNACFAEARAAALALLENWPQSWIEDARLLGAGAGPCIILPLPQEKPDAEAR